MSRFPGAVWRPVTRYQSGPLKVAMTPRRLILHTAVSSSSSMHGFFNVSGRATPHFYVNGSGGGEQYIDTSFRSTANLNGNHDCITVESWDGFPTGWAHGSDVPAWTDAQVEWLAELAVWCFRTHGIPLVRLASSRPGTTGIGWHRLGIDGNFPAGLLGGRVAGGEVWSSATGKVCPGDRKIRGTVEQVIPRAQALSRGEEPMQAEDFQRIRQIVEQEVKAQVDPLQERLNEAFAQERDRDAAVARRLDDLHAEVDKIPESRLTKAQVHEVLTKVLAEQQDTPA